MALVFSEFEAPWNSVGIVAATIAYAVDGNLALPVCLLGGGTAPFSPSHPATVAEAVTVSSENIAEHHMKLNIKMQQREPAWRA